MKDYYKINEISRLYGIGADSLRYYERLGVLTPQRDVNGYRLYSLKDIYKLNVIRDLRRLDFSMKQIKAYLDHQSIDNTLALLKEEQELIQKQLKSLQDAEASLLTRINHLKALSNVAVGDFALKVFPERHCLRLNEEITRDEETDFAIKKLQMQHARQIHDLGNLVIGAVPDMEALNQGRQGLFHSVFFILDQGYKEWDFVFPGGEYLSLMYRGGYQQSGERIQQVLSHGKAKGYRLIGDPIELYHIDNRSTGREEEFLTEIQVQIAQ